ncbi:MAG: hypothetical protein IMZ69_06895 [Spirochaetes bacterium]|nr:hypothetical protein [Spirochaetota bacterium]
MAWNLKKPDYKLADEPARAQVALILEHYQIDTADIPDKKQRGSTEAALEKLVGYVRQGMIEVCESPFKIIQHLKHPPGNVATIEYPELQGKHKVAMDARPTEEIYARIYELMGSLSGLGSTAFSAIQGVDLSAVECLGLLFLSA